MKTQEPQNFRITRYGQIFVSTLYLFDVFLTSCIPCWGGSHGFAWFHTEAFFTGFCKAMDLARIVAHNSHQLAHTYLLMRICVLYLFLLCRIFLFFFNRICENALNCVFQASSCFLMCMDHYIANAINTNKIFGHLYRGHNLVVKASHF